MNPSQKSGASRKRSPFLPAGLRRALDRRILGRSAFTWMLWLFYAGIALLVLVVLSILGGYGSARATHQRWLATAGVGDLGSQFQLGLEELQSGAYDRARQRFEYILQLDPTFPGAQEQLAQVLAILNATATPTPPPATPTPTPTRDPRPAEELFAAARQSFATQDWDRTIEQLLALRTTDPQFQVANVDGMLYMSLRSRGIEKILNRRQLEGGAFDLALAERFGPLDGEAAQARELARLYTLGLSFWEVHPEQAVYYFGQLAAVAPYLADASGWTAQARLVAALAQWGDQLYRAGDYCSAQEKYEMALQAGAGAEVQEAARLAAEACSPPTATPGATGTATGTSTIGPTGTPGSTATSTTTPGTQFPATSTSTATQSTPQVTTAAPTEGPTSTQAVETPTPSQEPQLSPTPSPTTAPSETPAPTEAETRPPIESAPIETPSP